MRINRVVAAAVCAVVLGAVGCAKEEGSLIEGAAQETFRAWLAKYDPVAERKESGIYLRFVERGTTTALTPTVDKSWLKVNYTLYAMSGVVGQTRNGVLSELIGRSNPITHFVGDMLPYLSQYSGAYHQICEGLRSAFQYLRSGDSVRIYIPSSLGYLSANNQDGMLVNSGYAGETTGYIDQPCYFDLRVQEVIDQPKIWDQNLVEQYVKSWGGSLSDSVMRGVYMRVLFDPGESQTTPITPDSTVRYYYASRFLDKHLIRSNVKKVLEQAKYFYTNSPASGWEFADPLSFTPSDFGGTSSVTDSTFFRILRKVLPKVRAGQTIEFVTISDQLPLGSVGQLTHIPQILPYEPRRMQLKLLRWDEKTDQAIYDWNLLF